MANYNQNNTHGGQSKVEDACHKPAAGFVVEGILTEVETITVATAKELAAAAAAHPTMSAEPARAKAAKDSVMTIEQQQGKAYMNQPDDVTSYIRHVHEGFISGAPPPPFVPLRKSHQLAPGGYAGAANTSPRSGGGNRLVGSTGMGVTPSEWSKPNSYGGRHKVSGGTTYDDQSGGRAEQNGGIAYEDDRYSGGRARLSSGFTYQDQLGGWAKPANGRTNGDLPKGWARPNSGAPYGNGGWTWPNSGATSDADSSGGWTKPSTGATYDQIYGGWTKPTTTTGAIYGGHSNGWSRPNGGTIYDDRPGKWNKPTSGTTYNDHSTGLSKPSGGITYSGWTRPNSWTTTYNNDSSHGWGSRPSSGAANGVPLRRPSYENSSSPKIEPAAAAIEGPRFSSPGTNNGRIWPKWSWNTPSSNSSSTEVIDSREAAQRYHGLEVEGPPGEPASRTIDSEEAAKKYQGKITHYSVVDEN